MKRVRVVGSASRLGRPEDVVSKMADVAVDVCRYADQLARLQAQVRGMALDLARKLDSLPPLKAA